MSAFARRQAVPVVWVALAQVMSVYEERRVALVAPAQVMPVCEERRVALVAPAQVMPVFEERQAAALVLVALARAVSASAHHRAIGLVRVVSANPPAKISRYRECRRAVAVAHLAWAGPLAVPVALVRC